MEIAYVCIFVSNLARAVEFYRDILGLEEELTKSTENFHAFKVGTIYIGLEPNGVGKDGEKTKAENPVLIQFKANSLEDLKAFTFGLEAHGVKILKKMAETGFGILTNFLDPDGNKLEILYQKSTA